MFLSVAVPSEALHQIVAMLRARERSGERTLAEARAGLEALASASPLPEGTCCRPAWAGGIRCEWITASEACHGTLLYLHGGGYCLGSINSHRALVARLARAGRLRGLAIEYRLAPEHPFPAAVEDATAAYRWLLRRGVAPQEIVVAGDSAGGGLTVATMLALRDAGVPLPAAGICLSPWVDLEGLGASMITCAARDPMVDRQGLLLLASAYLGGADARSPLAAPLYANLHGLPPLLIHVGTAECLLDDAIRLYERARAHGVEAELEIWDEMIHVWHAFAPLLPEAEQAIARVGAWIQRHLAGTDTSSPREA